jgi:hypothetical protein
VRYAAALACLVACGEPDPCADRLGTCVTVHLESASVQRIDQLELDVLYGEIHGTTTTQPAGGGATTLPLVTAIELEPPSTDPFTIGVVAAGKLSGVVLGTGAAQAMIAPGEHASIDIVLAAPEDCTAGSFYCGGDKLAGDPQTLYQCNGGGVPLARGVCVESCSVRPANDDTCRGAGGCTEGSDYCGGDKLDGDPQTLYRCTGGIGTNPRTCALGCRVVAGDDDICR